MKGTGGRVRAGWGAPAWAVEAHLGFDRLSDSSADVLSGSARFWWTPPGMLGVCIGSGLTGSVTSGLAPGDAYSSVVVPVALGRRWPVRPGRLAIEVVVHSSFGTSSAQLFGFEFRESGIGFGLATGLLIQIGPASVRPTFEAHTFPDDVGPHPLGDLRFALGVGWAR